MIGENEEGARTLRRWARLTAREAAVFAAMVLLTLVMTWPLARHPGRAVAEEGEPYLHVWTLDWVQHATTRGLPLWDAPMFHPVGLTLAFGEHLFGVAWPLIPVRMAGVEPIVLYNVAFVLAFAFAGWGGWILGRVVTGSAAAGLVAGVFFAFAPYRWDQLAQLPNLWSGWLPLILAALIVYVRGPSWARAAALGFALAMNGLVGVQWMIFGFIALALSVFVAATLLRRWSWRFWLPLIATSIIAAVALTPIVLRYEDARELHRIEQLELRALAFSATWESWVTPSPVSRVYGDAPAAHDARPERVLFPGLLALGLTLIGVTRWRNEVDRLEPRWVAEGRARRWLHHALEAGAALLVVASWWLGERDPGNGSESIFDPAPGPLLAAVALLVVRFAAAPLDSRLGRFRQRLPLGAWLSILWIAMGCFGSLGLRGSFHSFLWDHVPVVRQIEAPARWSVLAYTGLTATVAMGAAALWGAGRRRRLALATLLSVAFLIELNAAPIRWRLHPGTWSPAYEWLAETPIRGAVFELPAGIGAAESVRVLDATRHHRPIVNGYSRFDPLIHKQLVAATRQSPIPFDLFDRLEQIRTSILVVHADELELSPDDPVRRWLREGVRSGRLSFVRRFDEGIHGAWVFALSRVEPLSAFWRQHRGNAIGHTPYEELERFFAGQYTWSEVPVGDVTLRQDPATRALEIWGWAAAPTDISEVRLWFGNESAMFTGGFVDRPDVDEAMPFYRGRSTGFARTFSTRPEGIRLDTDLVVEIVDGQGASRRLDQIQFRWLPTRE